MNVFIHTCIHTITHIHMYTYTFTHDLCVRVRARIYQCACGCLRAGQHVCGCVCADVDVWVFVRYLCKSVCAHMHANLSCVHVFVCVFNVLCVYAATGRLLLLTSLRDQRQLALNLAVADIFCSNDDVFRIRNITLNVQTRTDCQFGENKAAADSPGTSTQDLARVCVFCSALDERTLVKCQPLRKPFRLWSRISVLLLLMRPRRPCRTCLPARRRRHRREHF